jgi:hypothetical protein
VRVLREDALHDLLALVLDGLLVGGQHPKTPQRFLPPGVQLVEVEPRRYEVAVRVPSVPGDAVCPPLLGAIYESDDLLTQQVIDRQSDPGVPGEMVGEDRRTDARSERIREVLLEPGGRHLLDRLGLNPGDRDQHDRQSQGEAQRAATGRV